MLTGIFAGVTWALETVILGIALGAKPFLSSPHLLFLAPFIVTFLHDFFSSIFALVYNVLRGNGKTLLHVFKTKSFKWLVLASAIGGPVGMTGYVMAVKYMGASVGAVASAVYPAIGTVLAVLFLKEKTKWYQWLFLLCTLLGVYGLSYAPDLHVENFWLGLAGAFMCACGWGVEAVILAKCFKSNEINNDCALWVRQTTSFLVYGGILLPLLGGRDATISLLTSHTGALLPTIAAAAFFATVSYLLYYRAIATIGAAKAMALNITYTAWAIAFMVILLQDFSVLNPLTLCCAAVVVVCGICSAIDPKQLARKQHRR